MHPARTLLALLSFTLLRLDAGESYFTSFDIPPFTALGDDMIAGTDGWTGSSLHANKQLHGIMSEDQHGVVGLGNAGYLGGNSAQATVTSSTSNKLVWLRRAVNIDPLALNQEVATFNLAFGIKDSSIDSLDRRDNFDVLIYNQVGQVLAGLRFDNTSLDTSGNPRRFIYRLDYSGSTPVYTNTNFSFLPETVETLEYRINFRTNRWTASLGGVPLFQDIAFHAGSYAKNLGFVLLQMTVSKPTTTSTFILPGDNYLLFDDYLVRTDPVTTTLAISKAETGAAKLTWNEEAGYSYRLQYTTDSTAWLDFASTIHTATVTADANYTDPASPVPVKRFYRVKRSYP